MISDTKLERVLAVVRGAGVADELEGILRAKSGGAPRRLSVELLFAACVLVHGPGFRSATLVQVHELLTKHLTVSTQFRLGTAWQHGTAVRKLQIHQVRYLFKAVRKALDYSPHSGAEHGERLTQAQRIEREAVFVGYLARMIHASSEVAGISDVVAIDATSMPSWSRGARQARSQKGEDYRLDNSTFVVAPTAAHDPDGRWGYQTATHDKCDANRFFGYAMLTASTTFSKGSAEQPLKLITAMTLIPANAPVAAPTLRMIDDLAGRQKLREVIVDRGFSMGLAEHWADPLLARGLDQVFDLADKQRGAFLDTQTGALMIDGWPCVPWTPKHLHKIARPPRFALKSPGPRAKADRRVQYQRELAALETFWASQAELAQYALVPNGRRKANGTRHYFTSTHARHTATQTQRKTKVYQQATVTLTAKVMPHLRQHFRWGSREWTAEWNRRNSVESGYGNLKTLDGEGLKRGWIRVVGLTAVGLMSTFAIVHYNLRMLRKWARITGYTGDDIVLRPSPEILGYEPIERPDHQAAVEPPIAA